MDNLEKGSWIINTIKHTTGVRTDTVEFRSDRKSWKIWNFTRKTIGR